MGTQFLRPTGRGNRKHDRPWQLKGDWGKKDYPPMSRVNLYGKLREELIASQLLSPDSPLPSNKYHEHVTLLTMKCSWRNGQWVLD
jgi:hypothetical protein